MSALRSEVDIEDEHGDGDGQSHEDHGEKKVLSDEWYHEWRWRNDFRDHEKKNLKNKIHEKKKLLRYLWQ